MRATGCRFSSIITADCEAEMCGNGVRCFAVYLNKTGQWDKPGLGVELRRNNYNVRFEGPLVRVDIGGAEFTGQPENTRCKGNRQSGGGARIVVDKKEFRITAVSMGNPHGVVYADELSDELVLGTGPKLESHPFFPNKANIEFVKVLSPGEIRMRVYERGCGETMACGTGACAAVVSGVLNGQNGNRVTVHLLGGDLRVE